MSTEKMREEFEKAYMASMNTDLPPSVWLEIRANGSYASVSTKAAWWAWQASRAAIEVELSEPYAVVGDYAACGGGRSVWDVEYAEKIDDHMCQKTSVYTWAQLEAAGLKVKP